MPDLTGNIEEIQNSLKASLGRGQGNLDQNVVAASKRVLLQSIEFKPASAPLSLQCNALKSKYTLLNPSSTASKMSPWNGTAEKKQHQQHQVVKEVQKTNMDGHEESLPRPKVVLYPEELLKMEWNRTPCRIGAGLVNMGNTCFFNSTLQCLTYTAPLVNYCMTGDHRQKCKKNGFCMMCEIQSHIRTSLECGGRSIKPHSMLQKLRCIAKHMKWGRQEDAHEFLRFVVDHLQQSCLGGENKNLDRHSKETTVINQIFGGYLRSQVTCLRCQAKSNTFDPFMDLSLDIKGVNTVEDALSKFVKPETLENENAYKCPKCKHKVRAHKRFSIQKPPNILTLQLNRFDFHRHLSGKINRFIKYPERINLRNAMSQKQGEPIFYHLYGVLVHSGHSSDCGHYYSYVKSPSKTWYCMNDSMVHQANYQSVFSADAYVLFYARVNRSPSTVSSTATSDHVKSLTPTKKSFIGPVLPGHIGNKSFSNGVDGKTSNDAGVPFHRDQKSPAVPKIVSHASSLPDSHRKISFPILTGQQMKLQQQQKNLEDDKDRIVLQIKHGNSTTMLKSLDGKSKVVNGNISTLPWGQNKTGLVPYNDEDSDSEQENRLSNLASVNAGSSSVKSSLVHKNNPASLVNGGGDNSLSHKPQQHLEKKQSPSKNLFSEGSSPCSSKQSTNITNKHSDNYKHISNRQHSSPSPSSNNFTKSQKPTTSSLSSSILTSPSKQLGSKPNLSLDLPNTTSKVKSCGSTWNITPHEGAPSPRGSNSSTNSVNSTSEWTVELKGVKGKPHKDSRDISHPLIINCTTSDNKPSSSRLSMSAPTAPLDSSSSTSLQQKSILHSNNRPSDSVRQRSQSPVPIPKPVPKFHARNGDTTPVNISDKQKLLSPVSSQISKTGSKFNKLFESRKRKHEEDSRDSSMSPIQDEDSSMNSSKKKKKSKKPKKEKDDRKRLISNSDSDADESVSSSCRVQKHLKAKESRKRSPPGSDSEDNDMISNGKSRKKKEKKRRQYSDSDSYSNAADKVSDGRKKAKTKRGKKFSSESSSSSSEEVYEWVEKTIESPITKANQVCVQSWNQHVKDDLHTKKDEEDVKSKKVATWDGTRHSKVNKELENSFYYKNRVVSWDGGKSQLSKDLEETRKAVRMQEKMDDYDIELDAGKVKKVKKPKQDVGRGSSHNAFQQYNNFKNKSCEEKSETSWSRDHSYFDRGDDQHHSNHGSHHRKAYNNNGYNSSGVDTDYNRHSNNKQYHRMSYGKHNGSKVNGNGRHFR